MITLEIHLKTALISDQLECFDCYLSCSCFLKTALPLPLLRKLRLFVVFKQALVETIQLAHAGSLYFYYEFDHNYLLFYDQFKVSLSTDDTTKKYFFYAGLAQSQQLKPLIFISKLITRNSKFSPRPAHDSSSVYCGVPTLLYSISPCILQSNFLQYHTNFPSKCSLRSSGYCHFA